MYWWNQNVEGFFIQIHYVQSYNPNTLIDLCVWVKQKMYVYLYYIKSLKFIDLSVSIILIKQEMLNLHSW